MWESRSKIIWKGTESFDIVSKWERRRLCWEYLGGKGGWNLLKNRESFVPSVCVRSVTQSYLTLSQPHGLQPTRLLCPGDYPGKNKWVAISYSRGSTWPRDWTWVSCVSCIGRRTLYQCGTWKALDSQRETQIDSQKEHVWLIVTGGHLQCLPTVPVFWSPWSWLLIGWWLLPMPRAGQSDGTSLLRWGCKKLWLLSCWHFLTSLAHFDEVCLQLLSELRSRSWPRWAWR